MPFSLRQIVRIYRPRVLGVVPVLLLFGLVLFFPPDGQSRSQWLIFAGRFHLLTIHFPIALLLVVPVLEIVGRHERFPHLKASVEFVLMLALLGSIVAALLGWSLARSDGYSGRLVTQHMWGGVLVAAACWVCWMLRARLGQPHGVAMYTAALVVAVGLVSWTGYRGGQMTQGESHLTDAMPADLKVVFGIHELPPTEVVDPKTFYGARVVPILKENCYSCHGQSSQRGRLRLDSMDAMLRGGKDGRVLVPGDAAASEIFRRISLPRTDERAMPPTSKRALTKDEIKVIELWIAAGASTTMPVSGIANAPATTAAPIDITFTDIDPVAVAKKRAKEAQAVAALQKRYPNILQYSSRGSAGLMLDAYLMHEKFSDADLAAFKPVADELTEVDLSGTSVSDRSAPMMAAMVQLRKLRVLHTSITDATVEKLSGLAQLESLNVLGDSVTASSLKSLQGLTHLKYVYAADTKIPTTAAVDPQWKGKIIF